MATTHDIPEPPVPPSDMVVGAPDPTCLPVHTATPVGVSPPRDDATMRVREALPPDTMILAPAFVPPPMRCPDDMWAMLVTAVDIIADADPDRAGQAALFTGVWAPQQPPADGLHDGDLVVRLVPPDNLTGPPPREPVTDVEMLLAYQGRWQRVGQWHGIDDRWPSVVAPTAAAVMSLHCDATEAVISLLAPPPSPTLITPARGGIAELLYAGLLAVGDEFAWDRPVLGVRHTARVRADGVLVLADGRVFVTPCGATTALGGNHQNGWKAFRRVSDGRTLGELRSELRVRGQ